MPHKPVLLHEVLELLSPKAGDVVLDGTLGDAGHAEAILEKIGRDGIYIGLDQDPEAIQRCRKKLKEYPQVRLKHTNFENFETVLKELNLKDLDAVILDVGVSSFQIDEAERGFSFDQDGPLDMRMNSEEGQTAADYINALSERELADVFWQYGEERRSRQFAKVIFEKRPIHTTGELVQALESALPQAIQKQRKKEGPKAPWALKNPAVKVFQALRILVNDELGVLERTLPKVWERLGAGGRFAVISFHSLEDRIVKHYFRSLKQSGQAELLTKKPIVSGPEELEINKRARSAKLRVIRKLT